MSRTAPRWASLPAGACAFAALAAGCGGSAGGGAIDVPGLEHELATVTRLEQLTAGYEFDMHASCAPSQSDGLRFSCRVDATSHGTPVNSWTVVVTCRPPGEAAGPRCVSDTGYALQ